MKLLFISSLLVAATNAADVDRRRINGITFADQAVEALNIVHKGQSTTEQKLVATRKGDDNKSDNKGDDKSSDNSKSKNRDNKSSSSKSSSSKSSGSGSRDGRGVCGESDGYCKDYNSSFLNFKKEGGDDKGGDSKSRDNKSSSKSKSSSSKSKSSSSGSRDGSRRTDRCFRACDTDRCSSSDRRRLECPASSESSDFVQKGQASSIQKLVWAGKKGDGGDDPADPPAPGKKSSEDDPTDPDKKNRNNSKSSSTKSSSKSKSSSSTGTSGDNSRSWPGSGDDICTDAPQDWCAGSSADGDDKCDDACDKDSDIRCTKDERKHLGCDATSKDVAAVKKLRRRARA